jgi:hypothetical protein
MARRDVDAAAIARWGLGLGVRGVRRCPEGRLGGRTFRPARPGVPILRAGIIDGTEAAAQEQASTIFYFLDVQEQDHVWLLPDTTRPILWSLALILAIFLSWTRGLDSLHAMVKADASLCRLPTAVDRNRRWPGGGAGRAPDHRAELGRILVQVAHQKPSGGVGPLRPSTLVDWTTSVGFICCRGAVGLLNQQNSCWANLPWRDQGVQGQGQETEANDRHDDRAACFNLVGRKQTAR